MTRHDSHAHDAPTRARNTHRAVAARSPAAPGHLGDATVGELLPSSLWYRERHEGVPEFLARVDTEDRASVLDAIQRIAEHEAVRRFLTPLLDLPVSLDREARSLLPGLVPAIHATSLGIPLVLDAAGQLSLGSLDALSATPFAAFLADELVAATQLLEIEGAVRRVDELGSMPATLDDLAAQPSKYPLSVAVSLREATHRAWRRTMHLRGIVMESNADQQARLDAANDRAYALRMHARRAHLAACAFHDQQLSDLTWAPGEAYFEHEAENLEQGGVLGHVGWGATKAFHAVGNALSAGSLDRLAGNNRAYRAGTISWDAYQHNERWSWVAGAAEVIATAVAGRAGGQLAAFGLRAAGVTELSVELSAQLATRLTARTTVHTATGLVAGSLAGAAAPAANDAVALVSAYASDDPFIRAYQHSLVGGPESWAQGAVFGAVLGTAGGALSARAPTHSSYAWQGFDPDGWVRASLDDATPVFDTLPPPIVERLSPARAALARRDVSTALRILDDVAAADRLPPPLVARLELDLAAELTGDQAITPLAAYRTPRALLPNGQWVEPTARSSRRYHGLDVSDAEAHRLMSEGLPARGPNLDLYNHSRQRPDTAFRGATAEVLTPDRGDQQGAGAWADDGGWVFEVEGVPSWHLESQLAGRVLEIDGFTGLSKGTRAELEHAILAGVPSERIISIRKIYKINGRLRPEPPIPNPNYRGRQ